MNNTAPVGILGGTFDPVHAGHLALAQEARRQLNLARVILIPAGTPWQRHPHAPTRDRLAMVRLAVGNTPGLAVDDREARRRGPTYSIDTVRELRASWGVERPLWMILGTDAFLHLPTWHHWRELLSECHFAIFSRPGSVLAVGAMPLPLRQEYEARYRTPREAKGPGGTIVACSMPLLDVSATRIREALRTGHCSADLLPPPVLDYIETNQLYRQETHGSPSCQE